MIKYVFSRPWLRCEMRRLASDQSGNSIRQQRLAATDYFMGCEKWKEDNYRVSVIIKRSIWESICHRFVFFYALSHAHKNTCTDLKWNRFNGNWLVSSSRDHMCKLYDIRNLKEEVQSFRGHKKEACSKSSN